MLFLTGVSRQASPAQDLRGTSRHPRASPARSCGAAVAGLRPEGPACQPQEAGTDRGSRGGRRRATFPGQTGAAFRSPGDHEGASCRVLRIFFRQLFRQPYCLVQLSTLNDRSAAGTARK